MTATQRVTQAVQAVRESKPLPRWVGLAGVILSTLAALGHDQLAAVFGERIANLIPVLGAIAAAVSHSVNGTGVKGGD
jgi:hypothetical protein